MGSPQRRKEIVEEAREVEEGIRTLYNLLRRPFDKEIVRSGLTVPQVRVLEELTRDDGLSLKELSGRVSLSHSTVSGIVDRLQRKGLVRRTPSREDRRHNLVELTDEVNDYVSGMSPSRSLGPLPEALVLAGDAERERIVDGLRSLRRLLAQIDEGREEDR